MNSHSILSLIADPQRQRAYRARGRSAVGSSAHNACAATAVQPYLELGVLSHIELMAEGLASALKKTGRVESSASQAEVAPGDLIVCADLNHNGLSDHVWNVVADLGRGWYSCFDNQGKTLTHRRRLDGADGRTPMRERLRLVQ